MVDGESRPHEHGRKGSLDSVNMAQDPQTRRTFEVATNNAYQLVFGNPNSSMGCLEFVWNPMHVHAIDNPIQFDILNSIEQ